jgi:protoheme ferro-lyase
MSGQHLVLVTYGEPLSPSFMQQLIYSWRILLGLTRSVAKIPAAAIPVIALSRARGRRRLWRAHRYSSPLEPITGQQAAVVTSALEANGGTWTVHVAYEFRRPLLGEVLDRIPAAEPVWIAPLYAADSAFTHELSRQTAAASAARRPRPAPVRVLPAIDAERLAEISAQHVLGCINGDVAEARRSALVLAAHGTLLNPERPIETGRADTERLCAAIGARLAPSFGMVANGWLNHTRGGRWTEPPIEETLQRVSAAGFSKVVYYPYGFLADNAESQLEGRLAAAARPELEVRFLPCLNDSARLAEIIAAQVHEGGARS